MRTGFSLVELSIVLVILGQLTGGILTGQSLIRAAELRSATTEFQNYRTATTTFRDKYFALPGDMKNATDFWGAADSTPGTCRQTASTSTATCNGDGDGFVELESTASREIYRYWQHLANAGLIEGRYNGTTSPYSSAFEVVPGTNTPQSKLSNAGWGIIASSETGNFYDTSFRPQGSTHWFQFGAAGSNNYFNVGVLKPEEAWNLDQKIDDGLPGSGKITTRNAYAGPTYCITNTSAALARYSLTNSSNACVIFLGM